MTNPHTEEKLRKLSPIDSQTRQKWLFYLSAEGKERDEADELIDILLYQQSGKDYQKKIHLDPPTPSDCYGKYQLGTVIYPPGDNFCSFGLREDEWIKHILIVGMTGAGKTNLSFNILIQLQKHSKPFLVFDWKRNYRDLKQLPQFHNLKVYTVAKKTSPFYFNPLIPPPETEVGEWLMKLVDVLKHAYFVGEGVEFLLREALTFVYEKHHYFSNNPRDPPLMEEVLNYIRRKKLFGRMGLWKASCIRVLESLCFDFGLGAVLNTRTKTDPNELLNNNMVLELDTLSDADKTFLTEALILWIYEYRKTEPHRETFKHAIIIEEAHHILNEKKERTEGVETIMETCLRQIREYSESIIIIDQEPTKLSNSIKANTNTKITFNLGNGKDILETATMMNLDQEEKDYINLLKTGQIILTVTGRITTPTLIQLPKINIQKGKQPIKTFQNN